MDHIARNRRVVKPTCGASHIQRRPVGKINSYVRRDLPANAIPAIITSRISTHSDSNATGHMRINQSGRRVIIRLNEDPIFSYS